MIWESVKRVFRREDAYAPRMPEVNVRADIGKVFAEARAIVLGPADAGLAADVPIVAVGIDALARGAHERPEHRRHGGFGIEVGHRAPGSPRMPVPWQGQQPWLRSTPVPRQLRQRRSPRQSKQMREGLRVRRRSQSVQ